MKRIFVLVGVILGIVGLDQLTKWLVLQNLPLGSSYEWIRKVVHFTYVQNEGAAFGILQNHRWVFMVLSSVAIVGVGIYLFRFCKQNWAVKISLAFLIGGGIGNMIDRVAFGYVVDFIELPWLWLPVLNQYFPIFNIADSFVTVGVLILAVALIRDIVREEKEKRQLPHLSETTPASTDAAEQPSESDSQAPNPEEGQAPSRETGGDHE
ncbi:MAG: signal peptidase II [Ruminococcaceae bacterium]|nr:signal peptidase II [Oscillospiraceae bacterium]